MQGVNSELNTQSFGCNALPVKWTPKHVRCITSELATDCEFLA